MGWGQPLEHFEMSQPIRNSQSKKKKEKIIPCKETVSAYAAIEQLTPRKYQFSFASDHGKTTAQKQQEKLEAISINTGVGIQIQ